MFDLVIVPNFYTLKEGSMNISRVARCWVIHRFQGNYRLNTAVL